MKFANIDQTPGRRFLCGLGVRMTGSQVSPKVYPTDAV